MMPGMKVSMTKFILVAFIVIVVGVFIEASGGNRCEYPAIFNFGDSNSDTGAISAAFTWIHPPNGQNFLGNLSGRSSNGRLIIDFITEELKLPYLSAYLNSVGASYRHGANFATGGSSILPGGYSPFHLDRQISQFIQFKSRTEILFNHHNGTELPFRSSIPRPDDFSRALYMIDIGQNDLAYGFQHSSEEQVLGSIPNTMSQFSQSLQQLYSEGARVFWIHNSGPIGCLPLNFLSYNNKSKEGQVDANGCLKSQNRIAQEFNRQLKDQVLQLRKKLPSAKLTYVDVYTAKYELVSNARKLGFVNPLEFCCGNYQGYKITCGQKTTESGKVSDKTCKNPSEHISWDGIHYSQAANLLITKQILSGAFSDPPVTIRQACL